MISRFTEQTRCPESLLESLQERTNVERPDFDFVERGEPHRSRPPAPDDRPGLVRDFLEGDLNGAVPSNLSEMVDTLRFERYVDAGRYHRYNDAGSVVRRSYYLLRPLLPVALRKHLQRIALKDWTKRAFPGWPVDFTTEDIFERAFEWLLQTLNLPEIPFIWYWPEGYAAGCVMTHDVETRRGRDFCGTMMRMEAQHGIVSSFELVPEQRYEVPMELVEHIRESGCEVCIHGLNHSGNLFNSEKIFREQAQKINQYAEKWGAIGFRSPVLYRNLSWLHALKIEYDLSVPNVGHLDPQPGGCCTVMPYFIGNIVELPVTTTQDYSLYHILKQRSLDLWKKQTEQILGRHGLITFIIHPDYTTARWSKQLYESLLDYLVGLRSERGLWIALPGEVNSWWRKRVDMELVNEGGRWRIRGPEAWRARVAYASLEHGRIAYRIDGPANGAQPLES